MDFISNEIIERIKNHCSLPELEKIGIPQSTFSKWKTRNTIPRSDDLYKIATYLNVSMEYLLTGNDKQELPPDETEILKNYRLLDAHDKHSISLMIEALTGR